VKPRIEPASYNSNSQPVLSHIVLHSLHGAVQVERLRENSHKEAQKAQEIEMNFVLAM
jgi:hypothetical protein